MATGWPRFGDWQVIQPLPSGGQEDVFLVEHSDESTQRVLKRLSNAARVRSWTSHQERRAFYQDDGSETPRLHRRSSRADPAGRASRRTTLPLLGRPRIAKSSRDCCSEHQVIATASGHSAGRCPCTRSASPSPNRTTEVRSSAGPHKRLKRDRSRTLSAPPTAFGPGRPARLNCRTLSEQRCQSVCVSSPNR